MKNLLVRKLRECEEFIAGDGSILREFLHPAKQDLKLRYSLALAKVMPGKVTKPHKLKTSEVYYIISGRGEMHIGNKSFKVGPDTTIYIPPHSAQYIRNTGKTVLKFICIVDPAWRKADEEIIGIK